MIAETAAYMTPDRRRKAAALLGEGRSNNVTVVLVAYRAPPHEMSAKTVDFSRASLDERWAAGLEDMNGALDMLEAKAATSSDHGFAFYDGRRSRVAPA